ncbi:MAG: cytochrome b [Pseudomonadota bacterium]
MRRATVRPDRWGPVSQAFHWISVVLLVAIAAVGLSMEDLPNSPDKIRLYALHKSLGLTLLAIVVLRLLWRLARPAPADLPGIAPWLRRAASGMHWGLYAMMLAMPLTGWLLNSAEGFPLQWFGLFNLPAIAPESESLAELAEDLHENGFWLLVLLATGHVFAALYHHVFLRDGTLQRMLPGRRRTPESAP